MSGVACFIIIRGNRAQANTRLALSKLSFSEAISAEQLIGGFESLCELGTSEYDGADVMTDAQKQQAADLMGAYNNAIEQLFTGGDGQHHHEFMDLIDSAHSQVYALLDAVANPP